MKTNRSIAILRTWILRTLILLVLATTGTYAGVVVAAEDSAGAKPATGKTSSSALDDELFKDLNEGVPAAEKKPASPKKEKEADKSPAPQRPAAAKPQTEEKPQPESKTQGGAKTPPEKSLNPLDEELLKDLGGDAETKPQRKPNDEAHGQPSGKPATGGNAEEKESDDPLVRLSRRVRDAEQRLRRTDSGDQTQELQRGIVEDLEKLIARIEQQKSQQSSSKSKGPPSGQKPGPKKPGPPKPGDKPGDKPSSNPSDSSDELTAKKAERPEAGKLKEMLEKIWGQLPERERQDVMQSSFDDFPTKYQYSIEQYFKTLLQRKD
ncbi:MAG: hypothetical protein K8U03_03710 [Planctomycetia bacterium]|nr:hypothetical protein [Planctomycetia bacterium]